MGGRLTRAWVTAMAIALTAGACGGASGAGDVALEGTAPIGSPPVGGASPSAAPATTAVPVGATTAGYRAAKPGELPVDGRTSVAGIRLPAGRRIAPSPAYSTASSVPVLWMTDADVLDLTTLVMALQRQFPSTGLWPVVLESLDGDGARPWREGELDPTSSSDPATIDAAATLTAWWQANFPPGDAAFRDVVAPFAGGFPGLARAEKRDAGDDVVAAVTAKLSGRLGLVAVTRPADVPAVLGYQGPVNYFSDQGQLSAVLRSWEDRFGAVLVGLGFDTMALAVRRPPTGRDDAERVAAEHAAVCPDIVLQGIQWQSIEGYAKAMRGEHAWACWWD